jgi:choice-of-anchor C domain-containing protein
MKNMAFGGFAAVLLAMSAFSQVAYAAPFTNGSFEVGPDPGGFTTLLGGNTSITGWTVDSFSGPSSIDYIGSYWVAGDPVRSIDLNGDHVGGISQTFDTVVNQTYNVSFQLSGNPDFNPLPKTLDVFTTGNPTVSFTFTNTSNSTTSMDWVPESFTFKATSGLTTIDFRSTTLMPEGCPCFGPALDNVNVTAVPEPETYAMMLAGLGLMGFIARRRKQNAAA